MAYSNSEVIGVLNDIIQTCKDGQEGFRLAAENIRNGEWRTLFNQYSRQRAQFAGELQAEVRRLGGNPETEGSVTASLHRGWMNIRQAITGGSDKAIISECERGEDSAVANYRNAIQKDLPPDIVAIVERQLKQVQEAHDRVRTMERQLEEAA